MNRRVFVRVENPEADEPQPYVGVFTRDEDYANSITAAGWLVLSVDASHSVSYLIPVDRISSIEVHHDVEIE